jgi:trimethylamine:corrinoid methyltransferase-like protein
MQSSSPTFSTPSTVTVSILSCKVIKKITIPIYVYTYSTACHRQKHQTKHNPQQAAHNHPKETQKKKTPTLKLPNLEVQPETIT